MDREQENHDGPNRDFIKDYKDSLTQCRRDGIRRSRESRMSLDDLIAIAERLRKRAERYRHVWEGHAVVLDNRSSETERQRVDTASNCWNESTGVFNERCLEHVERDRHQNRLTANKGFLPDRREENFRVTELSLQEKIEKAKAYQCTCRCKEWRGWSEPRDLKNKEDGLPKRPSKSTPEISANEKAVNDQTLILRNLKSSENELNSTSSTLKRGSHVPIDEKIVGRNTKMHGAVSKAKFDYVQSQEAIGTVKNRASEIEFMDNIKAVKDDSNPDASNGLEKARAILDMEITRYIKENEKILTEMVFGEINEFKHGESKREIPQYDNSGLKVNAPNELKKTTVKSEIGKKPSRNLESVVFKAAYEENMLDGKACDKTKTDIENKDSKIAHHKYVEYKTGATCDLKKPQANLKIEIPHCVKEAEIPTVSMCKTKAYLKREETKSTLPLLKENYWTPYTTSEQKKPKVKLEMESSGCEKGLEKIHRDKKYEIKSIYRKELNCKTDTSIELKKQRAILDMEISRYIKDNEKILTEMVFGETNGESEREIEEYEKSAQKVNAPNELKKTRVKSEMESFRCEKVEERLPLRKTLSQKQKDLSYGKSHKQKQQPNINEYKYKIDATFEMQKPTAKSEMESFKKTEEDKPSRKAVDKIKKESIQGVKTIPRLQENSECKTGAKRELGATVKLQMESSRLRDEEVPLRKTVVNTQNYVNHEDIQRQMPRFKENEYKTATCELKKPIAKSDMGSSRIKEVEKIPKRIEIEKTRQELIHEKSDLREKQHFKEKECKAYATIELKRPQAKSEMESSCEKTVENIPPIIAVEKTRKELFSEESNLREMQQLKENECKTYATREFKKPKVKSQTESSCEKTVQKMPSRKTTETTNRELQYEDSTKTRQLERVCKTDSKRELGTNVKLQIESSIPPRKVSNGTKNELKNEESKPVDEIQVKSYACELEKPKARTEKEGSRYKKIEENVLPRNTIDKTKKELKYKESETEDSKQNKIQINFFASELEKPKARAERGSFRYEREDEKVPQINTIDTPKKELKYEESENEDDVESKPVKWGGSKLKILKANIQAKWGFSKTKKIKDQREENRDKIQSQGEPEKIPKRLLSTLASQTNMKLQQIGSQSDPQKESSIRLVGKQMDNVRKESQESKSEGEPEKENHKQSGSTSTIQTKAMLKQSVHKQVKENGSISPASKNCSKIKNKRLEKSESEDGLKRDKLFKRPVTIANQAEKTPKQGESEIEKQIVRKRSIEKAVQKITTQSPQEENETENEKEENVIKKPECKLATEISENEWQQGKTTSDDSRTAEIISNRISTSKTGMALSEKNKQESENVQEQEKIEKYTDKAKFQNDESELDSYIEERDNEQSNKSSLRRCAAATEKSGSLHRDSENGAVTKKPQHEQGKSEKGERATTSTLISSVMKTEKKLQENVNIEEEIQISRSGGMAGTERSGWSESVSKHGNEEFRKRPAFKTYEADSSTKITRKNENGVHGGKVHENVHKDASRKSIHMIKRGRSRQEESDNENEKGEESISKGNLVNEVEQKAYHESESESDSKIELEKSKICKKPVGNPDGKKSRTLFEQERCGRESEIKRQQEVTRSCTKQPPSKTENKIQHQYIEIGSESESQTELVKENAIKQTIQRKISKRVSQHRKSDSPIKHETQASKQPAGKYVDKTIFQHNETVKEKEIAGRNFQEKSEKKMWQQENAVYDNESKNDAKTTCNSTRKLVSGQRTELKEIESSNEVKEKKERHPTEQSTVKRSKETPKKDDREQDKDCTISSGESVSRIPYQESEKESEGDSDTLLQRKRLRKTRKKIPQHEGSESDGDETSSLNNTIKLEKWTEKNMQHEDSWESDSESDTDTDSECEWENAIVIKQSTRNSVGIKRFQHVKNNTEDTKDEVLTKSQTKPMFNLKIDKKFKRRSSSLSVEASDVENELEKEKIKEQSVSYFVGNERPQYVESHYERESEIERDSENDLENETIIPQQENRQSGDERLIEHERKSRSGKKERVNTEDSEDVTKEDIKRENNKQKISKKDHHDSDTEETQDELPIRSQTKILFNFKRIKNSFKRGSSKHRSKSKEKESGSETELEEEPIRRSSDVESHYGSDTEESQDELPTKSKGKRLFNFKRIKNRFKRASKEKEYDSEIEQEEQTSKKEPIGSSVEKERSSDVESHYGSDTEESQDELPTKSKGKRLFNFKRIKNGFKRGSSKHRSKSKEQGSSKESVGTEDGNGEGENEYGEKNTKKKKSNKKATKKAESNSGEDEDESNKANKSIKADRKSSKGNKGEVSHSDSESGQGTKKRKGFKAKFKGVKQGVKSKSRSPRVDEVEDKRGDKKTSPSDTEDVDGHEDEEVKKNEEEKKTTTESGPRRIDYSTFLASTVVKNAEKKEVENGMEETSVASGSGSGQFVDGSSTKKGFKLKFENFKQRMKSKRNPSIVSSGSEDEGEIAEEEQSEEEVTRGRRRFKLSFKFKRRERETSLEKRINERARLVAKNEKTLQKAKKKKEKKEAKRKKKEEKDRSHGFRTIRSFFSRKKNEPQLPESNNAKSILVDKPKLKTQSTIPEPTPVVKQKVTIHNSDWDTSSMSSVQSEKSWKQKLREHNKQLLLRSEGATNKEQGPSRSPTENSEMKLQDLSDHEEITLQPYQIHLPDTPQYEQFAIPHTQQSKTAVELIQPDAPQQPSSVSPPKSPPPEASPNAVKSQQSPNTTAADKTDIDILNDLIAELDEIEKIQI